MTESLFAETLRRFCVWDRILVVSIPHHDLDEGGDQIAKVICSPMGWVMVRR